MLSYCATMFPDSKQSNISGSCFDSLAAVAAAKSHLFRKGLHKTGLLRVARCLGHQRVNEDTDNEDAAANKSSQ